MLQEELYPITPRSNQRAPSTVHPRAPGPNISPNDCPKYLQTSPWPWHPSWLCRGDVAPSCSLPVLGCPGPAPALGCWPRRSRGGQKLTKIPPWKRSRGPNESGLWWIQVDPPQSHAGLPKGPNHVLWVPNGDEARAGPPAPCARRVPCHKSAGFRFPGASPEQIPPRNEPVSKFLGKRLQLCAGGTGASRGGDREQWPGGEGHSGARAPSGLHHLRGGFLGAPSSFWGAVGTPPFCMASPWGPTPWGWGSPHVPRSPLHS